MHANTNRPKITELKKYFRYDPSKGVLFFRKTLLYKQMVQDSPVVIDHKGRISFGGKSYSAGYVAWAIHHGEYPSTSTALKYKNNNKHDIKITNLYLILLSEVRHLSTQNAKGNYFYKTTEDFRSRILVQGEITELGRFSSAEAANQKYQIYKKRALAKLKKLRIQATKK